MKSDNKIDSSDRVPQNPNPAFYEAISSFYDQLYREVDPVEAVRQWLLLIDRYYRRDNISQTPLRLLELGCGTGRYLQPWCRAGFDVTGVDCSAGMLQHAHAQEIEPQHRHRIRIVHHDIRLPSKRLMQSGLFNIVVAHFNFLNLFPQDEIVLILRQLSAWMVPGGRFFTDCAPPSLMPFELREQYQLAQQEVVDVRIRPNPKSDSVEQTFSYKEQEFCAKYWLHSTGLLAAAAEQGGWSLEEARAWRPDHPQNPWQPDSPCDVHRLCVFRFL